MARTDFSTSRVKKASQDSSTRQSSEATSVATNEYPQGLCQQILQSDNSIRFAAIANHYGRLIASAYRTNLAPLLDRGETEHYAVTAVTRALLRESFEEKLGKLRHSIGTYEKLIRAIIPIEKLECEKDPPVFLLLSFDLGSDADSIIEGKILPILKDKE